MEEVEETTGCAAAQAGKADFLSSCRRRRGLAKSLCCEISIARYLLHCTRALDRPVGALAEFIGGEPT
jgi:hypothetical protein